MRAETRGNGHVLNISESGLYFYTHYPLKADTDIELTLRLEGRETPIEIKGRIMRHAKLRGDSEAVFSGTGVSITNISEGGPEGY